MRKTLLAMGVALSVILLLTHCTTDPEKKVVATVGDRDINVAEFRDYLLQSRSAEALSKMSVEVRRNELEKLVELHQKSMRATELDLDSDSLYQTRLTDQRNRLLATELYNDIVYTALIPDSRVDRYLEWQKRRVSGVFIRVGYMDAKIYQHSRSHEEAAALAEEHKAALAASDTPEETCKALSDDRRNRPYFERWYPGLHSFEVDSLVNHANPGDIIGPVDTERGFVIVRVLDVNMVNSADENLPLEERRQKMRTTLRNYTGKAERDRFDSLSVIIREKQDYDFRTETAGEFVSILTAWGEDPERDLDSLRRRTADMVLATVSGEEFHARRLLAFFGPRLVREYFRFQTVEDLRTAFVEPQATLLAWARESEARGLADREAVTSPLAHFRRGSLAEAFDRHAIESRIEITDAEIMARYESHGDDYTDPERIEIFQIPVASEAVGETVAAKAKAGEDFRVLYQKYNDKSPGNRYILGYQSRESRYPALVEAAFDAGPNTITGPVTVAGRTYVIKTGEVKPREKRPLDIVRNMIRRTLEYEARERLTAEADTALDNRFPASIDDTVLQEMS